jgi:hypothetical protein
MAVQRFVGISRAFIVMAALGPAMTMNTAHDTGRS